MRHMLAIVLAFLVLAGAGFQAQAGESASGYYDLGVFAYEDGDFQAAEGHFKKALDIDPENPVYRHYLGRVYFETGKYVSAKENLESARSKDPDLPGLNYDLGLLYYKIEQYDMASEHLTVAADEDPANVLAAYYGGICLYRQKRYDEAGPLFEKAADKSPSLKVNSTYYAGICDYHAGDISGAEKKFTYVKENAGSSIEKENADKWLAILGQKDQQKPYTLEFRLHYLYDDNVPLDPSGQEAAYSDDSDSGIYGYAMGRYNIVNRSDFVLGAGVSRGQTWYSDLTEFNMSDTNADLYTTYSTGSFLFGLNYIPRLYTIDDEDYLLQHEVRPSFYWQPNRDLLTRFVYSYYVKDYRQNDARDGGLHDFYLDLYYHVFGGRGFVFGGLGYESSSSDDDAYNYTRPKAKAGLSTEVGWKVIQYDSSYVVMDIPGSSDLTKLIFYPSEYSLAPGLKYVWQVQHTDSTGRSSFWSDECTFKVGNTMSETLETIKAGKNLSDFRMISIVHWPDNPNPQDVYDITYDPNNYRIGTWDPEQGKYIEFGGGLTIEPGRAYWVLSRDDLVVYFDGIPVSMVNDIEVCLYTHASTGIGWNMIAPPNAANYRWNDVLVGRSVDGDPDLEVFPVPVTSPVASTLINHRTWEWRAGEYIDHRLYENFVLEYYKGYWVKAIVEGAYLVFPESAQVAGLATPRNTMLAWKGKAIQWMKSLLPAPREAIADNDLPPMPMDTYDGSTNPLFEGCFVQTLR